MFWPFYLRALCLYFPGSVTFLFTLKSSAQLLLALDFYRYCLVHLYVTIDNGVSCCFMPFEVLTCCQYVVLSMYVTKWNKPWFLSASGCVSDLRRQLLENRNAAQTVPEFRCIIPSYILENQVLWNAKLDICKINEAFKSILKLQF